MEGYTEQQLFEMTPMEVVSELNSILFDKTQEEVFKFSYLTDGNVDIIEFNDGMLWNSEIDERTFIEEKNDHEPLLPFIIKLFNEYCDTVSNLKISI